MFPWSVIKKSEKNPIPIKKTPPLRKRQEKINKKKPSKKGILKKARKNI